MCNNEEVDIAEESLDNIIISEQQQKNHLYLVEKKLEKGSSPVELF